MPVSIKDWLLYFVVVMLLPAVISYLCGCINGAILISTHYLKDDVRTHGSGNAGLTNFYRNYGARYAALVLALDALKMVGAIVITCSMMGWTPIAKLWGGLFCVLGHVFPVTYKFKGGKGVLSGATLLLMLDCRVALICIGIFLLLVVITHYVSLGSVIGSASAVIAVAVFYPGQWLVLGLVAVIAGILIISHRSNIVRLVQGTENKFSFR